ncbi:MAG TPA: ABC transporter permease [Planctomycetes bacterium]|nr:ABC transporter permease [Planctomycetota bacterium]
MRLLFFLVWKSFRSEPLRHVLTLFGVLLGVAVVTSVHVLDHNTILSQLVQKRGDFGRVDLELRPRDGLKRLGEHQEYLARQDGIQRLGLIGQVPVLAEQGEGAGQGRKEVCILFGLMPRGQKLFGHYLVAEGKDLSELDPFHMVLVGPALAETFGLRPGSRFRIRSLPRITPADCKDGKWTPPRAKADSWKSEEVLVVKGILQPLRLARRQGGLVILGSFGLARKLSPALSPVFQVKRTEGFPVDGLKKSLSGRFLIDDRRSAMIGEDADERAFRNGVKVLGSLALALGMFVIFHTLSHALAERMRRVGILRCLGATQGQVAMTFFVEACLLAVLGSVLGLGLGLLLAKLFAGAGITTLGLGKTIVTFEIPWKPLLWIMGLGAFFTLVGAAFPLLKVRRLTPRRILFVRDLAPPADLLRGVNVFLFATLVLALPMAYLAMTPLLREEGGGAGLVLLELGLVVGVFFGVLLLAPGLVRRLGNLPLRLLERRLPLACFLVRKNLLRAPARVASAVAGLTLVALAMVGLKGLTGSLKEEIRAFSRAGMRDYLFVRGEALSRQDWAKLRALPGVRAVLPLGARAALPFLTRGTQSEELARLGAPFGPELLKRMKAERSMVVSTRLARLRGLVPGSEVPISVGGGKIVPYKVLAISDRAGFFPDERAFALVDLSWFHRDFCLDVDRSGDFQIGLEKGASPEAVERGIRAVYQDKARLGWVRSGWEVERFHLGDVDRDFRFFDVLLLLLLVLAGTGQVNLMTLATMARARENWVLRALGVTRPGFFALLGVESVVVGFLTFLLTVVAGLPLSWVLVRGLRGVSGLDLPFYLPWRECFWVGLLAFGISMLCAVVPALRLGRGAGIRPTD